MKQKFDITGMTCSACSARVEKAVGNLNGVKNVTVNLLTNSMQTESDEDISSVIVEAVEKAGYGAVLQNEGKTVTNKDKNKNSTKENPIKDFKFILWVSFGFLIPLMYISMGHMWGAPLPRFLTGHENAVSFAFTQFLLCLPVVAVNSKYFTKGFSTLWHRAPNMDSLIAVGSSAALVYGIFAIYRMSYALGVGDMETVAQYHMDLYFESAAMILALITFGKFLEAKSKGKTSEALEKLIDMQPKTAIVEVDGQEKEIDAQDLAVGDIIIVKPGSSVPADGIVVFGQTSVDEAAITGESIPVHKESGDSVTAATMNKGGYIKVKATKVGADTVFAQIIKLVEDASATKAPIAKLADKIAGVFVPVVMAIALVTAVVWLLLGASFEFALSSAICVLVISCPCALGLATPVAIMVGTGKGAENGILIKSGEALEAAHSVDTVVLDKTGTITMGKPIVTDILTFETDKNTLLSVASAMESYSEHPLSEAVVSYAKEQNIKNALVENFSSHAGKGISAVYNNSLCLAGNEKFMAENNINLSNIQDKIDALANDGKTPLIFAFDGKSVGIIAVADVIKPDSAAAIEALNNMGLSVIMLTGDNKKTANGIGKNLRLSKIIAEVLPQDKEKVISALKAEGKTVAMVGDGINDAPALVSADVGIAIGNGTDVAIESADIILMNNHLTGVYTAIKLSKAVIKNIKQNLFWAFFYNCLGIPLAAGVFYSSFGWKLSPMFGAAAMSFSSLFVVTNALRLKMFKGDSFINNEPVYNKKEIKENNKMITLKIEGMMCGHCQKHVSDALNAIEGVTAAVNLENKEAVVENAGSATVEQLKDAVAQAGYTVTQVIE